MKPARTLLGHCAVMAVCLPLTLGQVSSPGPHVKLTCLTGNETISRHTNYPITWTAANIQPNTALSIRLQWIDQMPAGGGRQTVESNRAIGYVLDSKTQERLAALNRSTSGLPTIESGKYLWDLDKFCKENRNGNKSVCEPDAHYRLQMILRSADDPCGDNMHCANPRSFFKVFMSDGAFTFRD
jgi:hypothetical protein